MDKWSRTKSKQKGSSVFQEDSLLPPSLRHLNQELQPRQKKKKRTFNGLLKKVSAILDQPRASSSSSSSSLASSTPGDESRTRRKRKGKSKARVNEADSLNANSMQLLQLPNALSNERSNSSNNDNNNNNNSRSHSCSDGSLDGGSWRARKGEVKARVEARRVEQLRRAAAGDYSSLDESGAELERTQQQQQQHAHAKKRSRASRTERYLKRVCNGRSSNNEAALRFRPIERAQLSNAPGSRAPLQCCEHDITNDNFYARHTQVGVNPLVQQTLQYFSEFDRELAARQQLSREETRQAPPKPPSRDHTSRILVNGAALDKYQRMMQRLPPEPPRGFDKENRYPTGSSRSSPRSPNAEVSDITEGRYLAASPKSASPPFRNSLNMTAFRPNFQHGTPSPSNDTRGAKNLQRTSPCFSNILLSSDLDSSNVTTSKLNRSIPRRSSKNLEEALCELEAIYNSLQLGDEELLDRADRRTMEEFLYKGLAASPDPGFDCSDAASRRNTPVADLKLDEANRLKDDMAYRRMHPKERPTSVDGQSSLSNISYLMTSPIPCHRDEPLPDPRRRPRGKEPDVTLDDVVFRSMHHANNTLKVAEPQPPFGIPLGPIATAADSDYLHASPAGDSDRARSPYIPCKEPDIVTDDLAFRNLRKDAQPSSRQSSPSLPPSTPPPPPPYCFNSKKRATRSLSANLYGLINRPTSPLLDRPDDRDSLRSTSTRDDYYLDGVGFKEVGARRTSDPEIQGIRWQTWQTVGRNSERSADPSKSSCDRSSDESTRPAYPRLTVADDNTDRISSACSSRSPPSPPARPPEPSISNDEILVYKQLCEDLENLVQLTRSIDDVPRGGQSSVKPMSSLVSTQPAAAAAAESRESCSITKAPIDDQPSLGDASILDNLDGLGDEDSSHNANKSQDADQGVLRVETKQVVQKESLNELCDSTTKRRIESPQTKASRSEVENEDDEKKDGVDEKAFLRSVQLAKSSGDWKESTPKGDVAARRTSLAVNDDSRRWQGMNKCNHKYNSMPAKTSSILTFRQYGSKPKSKNRKSMCTIS